MININFVCSGAGPALSLLLMNSLKNFSIRQLEFMEILREKKFKLVFSYFFPHYQLFNKDYFITMRKLLKTIFSSSLKLFKYYFFYYYAN